MRRARLPDPLSAFEACPVSCDDHANTAGVGSARVSAAVVEMFANRLRKNARHLSKWARRNGVACWRMYDRDIPEVPITVDTYDGALVINDYRIDPGDRAWLDALAAAAREVVDPKEIHVKQR